MCPDMNGDLVDRKLQFNTSHELLSYLLATNVPGATSEFFECRDVDRNDSIAKLVRNFVNT